MPTYRLYTDGSTAKNPGRGAWASLLVSPGDERTVFVGKSGGTTTSQRMEISALAEPLRLLGSRLTQMPALDVFTDSYYVVDMARKLRKAHQTDNEPRITSNGDLWIPAAAFLVQFPQITLHWIKGHAGQEENEFVDYLARLIALNPDKYEGLELPDGVKVVKS